MNFFRRLRALFHRDTLDREMDDEVRFHLEMQARENAEAGASADEAAHVARRQFGHIDGVKETVRARRGVMWLENFARDLRLAVRSLRRSPGYTFGVVAILATSIGLVTAIVNVSRPVLLPEVPYLDADRLVILRERKPPQTGYWGLVSQRFLRYAEHTTSLAAFAARQTRTMNLIASQEPRAVRVSCVTEQFFAVLGVACNQGRAFLPEEHLPDATGETVVLSHQAWTTFFGRDPSLIGKDVLLGDRVRRIAGILPPGFRAPRGFEDDGIYLPTRIDAVPGQIASVSAIGRLKPEVTLPRAEAELRATHHNEAPPSPAVANHVPLEPVLTTLRDVYLERGTQPFRLFLGAVALLFVIGCTAVANLTLSRTIARRRELGVRLALGGSRGQVTAFVLGESFALSLFAAACGAAIAWWAQRGMAHLLPADILGDELRRGFDGSTISIAMGLGVLTCLLSGLVPAWHAGRVNLNESLKEGAGAVGESPPLRLLRNAFVVTQSALAVALLVGAGLMIESVYRLQRIDLGFDPANKILLMASRRGTAERTQIEQRNNAILDRLATLPDIKHLAQTSTVPLVGLGAMSSYNVDGRSESESVGFYRFDVSPDFFSVMDLPMLAGRGFDNVHASDPPVAVIDEHTARKLFPDQDPIGSHLISGRNRVEIIGVTRSISVSYRGTSAVMVSGELVVAQIYRPVVQSRPDPFGVSAVLQVAREPGPDFAATVRRIVYEIDPTIVVSLRPLEQFLDEQTRAERHTLTMLQILAGLALALAAFGLFSVMAYTVAQRRGEFGLRMVLGATPGRLIAFVMKRGLALAMIGVILGLAAAAGLTHFMRSVLYETSPYEPVVYVVVAVLLLAAAALACWLPARRAAKVDPMLALRAD